MILEGGIFGKLMCFRLHILRLIQNPNPVQRRAPCSERVTAYLIEIGENISLMLASPNLPIGSLFCFAALDVVSQLFMSCHEEHPLRIALPHQHSDLIRIFRAPLILLLVFKLFK
jgi:hypothetical protein